MNTKISHYKLLEITENEMNLLKPKSTKELKMLMKEYNLTLEEATLFTFLLGKYIEKNRVSITDFESDRIKSGSKDYFKILKTLKSLVKKDIIIIDKRRGRSELLDPAIEIDEGIFSQIVLGEELFEGVDFNKAFSIIEAVNDLLEKRDDKKVSESKFFNDYKILLKKINKELSLYGIISKYTDIEQLMIFKSCIEKIKGYGTEECNRFFSSVYDSISDVAASMKKIYSNSLKSFRDKVLILNEDSPYRNRPDFDIVDKYFEKILEGKFKQSPKGFDPKFSELIKYKNIKNELFFDKEIKEHVDTICNASTGKKYNEITKELKKAGLPTGLVALLHGYPGTGKTATVFEIAKKTKRDVLQVDISNIKDMYVGESEKRLKQVFTEYRKGKEVLKNAPILLFNEADALIGKRIDIQHSVDQMYNNMQNILLEELEKFDGIFFATTNLVDNMDSAFNRRFLYKVEYKKPSKDIRKQIWNSKIKDISENTIDEISDYELTGGQIDNVVRKYMIDKILKQGIDQSHLVKLCNDEISFKQEKGLNIGFR
ncbi:MAG: ATP-binding protein [Candidatus Delongbacteria bacterium]|nr:ATP-binding protein [Candidatus Delongbacteria bacterium]